MKITVKITKEILKASMFCKNDTEAKVCMTGQNCAIGKAIFQIFGRNSWVGNTSIEIFNEGLKFSPLGHLVDKSDFSINLPYDARAFILDFDKLTPEDRIEMNPFDFEIDVPNEVIDMIGIGQVYRVLSESKTLELSSI